MKKQIRCTQHQNTADQLCLYSQCQNRLMCLLCEHQHETYTSVLKPIRINYSIFEKKVNTQIDRSIDLISEQGVSGINKQIKMVENYYDSVFQELKDLLNSKKKQNLHLLANNQAGQMQMLVKARIQGNYATLSPGLFDKIKQVYEGNDLQMLARIQRQEALFKAHTYMHTFNQYLVQFLNSFSLKLRINVPEIRIANQENKNGGNLNGEDYAEEDRPKNKLDVRQFISTSPQQCNFQSIISDCLINNKQIMTTSYDKSLKIFDKHLKMVKSLQFSNILQKIETLNHEQTYAVAVSKELHIIKLQRQKNYQLEPLMVLRGHTQRINDLHTFNTRILATTSNEGLKLWDLYKQKCEYTLRDSNNPGCFNFIQSNYLGNSKSQSGKVVCIGYHNHEIKTFSLENMKHIRSYDFGGLPLYISQQRRQASLLYVSGFPHTFTLYDLRMPNQAFSSKFKQSDALSCFYESIFEKDSVFLGSRSGYSSVFDLRKQKQRLKWKCHNQITNLSKPNGVVKIFEDNYMQLLTVGCNDKTIKGWKINQPE